MNQLGASLIQRTGLIPHAKRRKGLKDEVSRVEHRTNLKQSKSLGIQSYRTSGTVIGDTVT